MTDVKEGTFSQGVEELWKGSVTKVSEELRDTGEKKKKKVIGNLGKLITFKVSDKKILTFTGFTRKVSGRWQQHARVSKKPLQEFVGPDLGEISFEIEINAFHGYKPRKTMENINKSIEKGVAHKLVIGGKRVGKNYWIIKNVTETWDEIYSQGELVRAKVKLTLEEYL